LQLGKAWLYKSKLTPALPVLRGEYNRWTGLLDWTAGLDYWTGLLDWTSQWHDSQVCTYFIHISRYDVSII